MGIIVRPNSYTNGQVADGTQVNADFNTIYNDYNGNITNANIAAAAGIAYSKLNLAGSIAGTDLTPSAITLGYAQVTTSQGSITTETDLTGLSVTVTVPAGGRRIKITGYVLVNSTVGSDFIRIEIKEGTTVLAMADGGNAGAVAGQNVLLTAIYSTVATAGSHTYKLAALRAIGTGTISTATGASAPLFILVEAI